MIKLEKKDEPEVLVSNKNVWTNEYLSLLNAGSEISATVKGRYRHKDIKAQIFKETNNKCAYCESIVSHVCPGDIEHILPKKKRPEMIFEWSNLTLSCEECNRPRKRDYYNPKDPLLNPYIDNPEEHLKAIGPLIDTRDGSRKGDITTRMLGLNERKELLDRRIDRLKKIFLLKSLWEKESNPDLKEAYKEDLLKEADPEKEYRMIVKQYLLDIGL
ncbi:HNH endonuclease [Peribacillus butanolivorans]|uniref:HNH endonuclease n=1 Tax=Peribacillus butanolivorans TaxID=421767 RepID=UPI00365F911D